ncbi:PTS system, cellobiose-specific IIB component [Enterococcus sp. AZ135]|uniref:PTS sugar transporter subunit IIB n=1 Tax=unclassified Enterococcus TaxID=2608891 RepID=UPI003F29AD4F
MKKIMLSCGSGASSGFLAGNARKAASEAGVEFEFFARSDSEIEDFADEIDLLLIGPHLAYLESELAEIVAPYDVPIKIIPQQIYGKLDGKALLDFSQKNMKK